MESFFVLLLDFLQIFTGLDTHTSDNTQKVGTTTLTK